MQDEIMPSEPGSERTFIDKFNPQKRVQANRVFLRLPSAESYRYIFFCPCWIRVMIQNFSALSVGDLNARMKVLLKFDIDVTGLASQFVEIIKDNVTLTFHQDDESIRLRNLEDGLTLKVRFIDERRILSYRIHRTVTLRMIPSIFWSPYEILNLMLSITIQQIGKWEGLEELQLLIRQGLEWKQKRSLNTIKQRVIQQKLQKKKSELNRDLNGDETKEIMYQNNVKSILFNFNILDYDHKGQTYYINRKDQIADAFARFGYSDETYYGNYHLASKLIEVEYTNYLKGRIYQKQFRKRNKMYKCLCRNAVIQNQYKKVSQLPDNLKEAVEENQKEQEQKTISFRNAHFKIPVFSMPIVSLLTVFLPIWLMGWITVGVYFQQFGLGERLATIATLLLGYIAFMPVIRDKLPPNPSITFIQILLISQIFVSVISGIESFALRDEEADHYQTSPLFWICFCIQTLEFLIIVILIIYFECFKKMTYKVEPGVQISLKPSQWSHIEADQYFTKKQLDKQIRFVEFPMKKLYDWNKHLSL